MNTLQQISQQVLTFTLREYPIKDALDLKSKAHLYRTIKNISYLAAPIFAAAALFALYSQPFSPLLLGAIVLSGSLIVYGMITYKPLAEQMTKQAELAQSIADIVHDVLGWNNGSYKQFQIDHGMSVNRNKLSDRLIIEFIYFEKVAKHWAQHNFGFEATKYPLIIYPAALKQAFVLQKMQNSNSEKMSLDQVVFEKALDSQNDMNANYCQVNGQMISYKQMQDNWDKPLKLLQIVSPPKMDSLSTSGASS